MSEKLKRLSIKLADLLPEIETAQESYELLTHSMQIRKDYFNNIDVYDRFKLIIYSFSFKTTGNFKLSDNILNNLFFANLFTTDGVEYSKECRSCEGQGEYTCSDCSGHGTVNCYECDGEGDIVCDECNGKGDHDETREDHTTCDKCNGRGVTQCDVCDGSGELTCPSCSGSETEICANCDGSGEELTDDKVYSQYFICSWNEILKGRCELNENTLVPVVSEDYFIKIHNEYIILSSYEHHENFVDEVIPNEIYCLEVFDEPKLLNSSNMEFISAKIPNIIKFISN